MKILVVYATTEGQTRKIAGFVANRIEAAGPSCDLIDSADVGSDFVLPDADGAIIAASVHVGRYQTQIAHIVRNNLARLDAIPTMFVSVSLAAAGDADDLEGVKDCADRFLRDVGWTPDAIEHVAGAFLYTRYDFFKRWTMKLIARQHGAPTDTSQDYEMTDWEALARVTDDFLARIRDADSWRGRGRERQRPV